MFPVQTLNSQYFLVAGNFATDSLGAIVSQDLPFVSSITTDAVSTGTRYILHLSDVYQTCAYANAVTTLGAQTCTFISTYANDTTDPRFIVVLHDMFSRGPYVINGGDMSDPTTASTQITGAGDTEVRVNLSAAEVVIADGLGGLSRGFAAATDDFVAHSGSCLLAEGQSVNISIVVTGPAGVMTWNAVAGTPAATGEETIPSASDVGTALGLSTTGYADWTQVGYINVARPADETLVQTNTLYKLQHPFLRNPARTSPVCSQTVSIMAVLVK